MNKKPKISELVDTANTTATIALNKLNGTTPMSGTDYTTSRPRGIKLQTEEPTSIPNGEIVGIYE